jgi:microcystin-dependent protein
MSLKTKYVAMIMTVALAVIFLASSSLRADIRGLLFQAPTVNGKSNVYDPQAGEIIYDSSDSKFYGRDGGGNWVDLSVSTLSSVPAGTILPYAGTTAPTGFLLCDGSAVSRSTYATLFALVGSSFGSGDGSTTFNLPDFRGRFLRGLDGAAGRDPDSGSRTAMATGGATGNNIGSVQADGLKSHTHAGNGADGPSAGNNSINWARGTGSTTTGVMAAIANTGGNETRPVNAYTNFIVKY